MMKTELPVCVCIGCATRPEFDPAMCLTCDGCSECVQPDHECQVDRCGVCDAKVT